MVARYCLAISSSAAYGYYAQPPYPTPVPRRWPQRKPASRLVRGISRRLDRSPDKRQVLGAARDYNLIAFNVEVQEVEVSTDQ